MPVFTYKTRVYFSLFLKLKTPLKRKCFENIESIESTTVMLRVLENILKIDL